MQSYLSEISNTLSIDMLSAALIVLATSSALLFTVFYLVFLRTDRISVIDSGWGLNFFILIGIAFFLCDFHHLNLIVLVVCCTVWSWRLALYLHARNHGQPEDFRYQEMRDNWKNPRLDAFYRVFMLQWVLGYAFALPLLIGILDLGRVGRTEVSLGIEQGLNYWLIAGLLVFGFGFGWEVWADKTIDRFVKEKQAGKHSELRCLNGPWRFSKYPNYFGEITLWFGLSLLLNPLERPYVLINPLLTGLVIRYVSGVPFLEKRHKQKKRDRVPGLPNNLLIPYFLTPWKVPTIDS